MDEEARSATEPKRTVDVASLKALAHPLRIEILDTISRLGPQTSGTLAEILGESTGSTSYHLRQLARHDFLREVEGRGSGRERWWDRPKGSLQVVTRELADDPATAEAAHLVSREFEHRRAAALADFMEHGWLSEPAEWSDAAMASTSHARLTASELAMVSAKLEDFASSLIAQFKGRPTPEGARPVQIHINAFPLAPQRQEGPRRHQEKP
ncbi:transcriptional regulator [Sinomonas cellulolyticus]|uniref:Helix-turn-helix transcriptional regulator n=1 Tax=Sinomonas cellulolyticus TaxID=2801916 RepID=A0ABS1K382_9MICC|nr:MULTISPECIES: helix-turn-helix domain-containing protein [Sinomonas]MBL0704756.1 helix-turn-helix transcriptional regulator [Sinomonas cellulolyticus]GHG46876.1 transcriptional regulator [Sinomonas sp. KCTC 49339]